MTQSPGVSEPCPCGSGRKFGSCCFGREYDSAVLSTNFGLAELSQGRPLAAVAAFRQALALAPTLAPVHNNLGIALKDLGCLDEAETAYRAALQRDPNYAPAHHNLGELLQRRGQLNEARHCFESALRADPALSQSRLSLGNTLVDLRDLQGAVSCFREALSRGAAPAGVHMSLGVVLRQLGDLTGALAAFEHSVATDPSSAEAHFNLGSALLEVGRAEAAARVAREALRLRPGFQEALTLSATAMAATGAPEAAVDLLEPARGTTLPRSQTYLLLAAQLMKLRLLEPARRCLERVLDEGPEDAMAQHLLAALTGSNPQSASHTYVRQLFDASAATFDRDLVSDLKYDIPREMVVALRTAAGQADTAWDVLDLGCGTGLVGAEIAPLSRRLVGIDLSPKMIERARSRGIYGELHCADIVTALAAAAAQAARYHVVAAADVFIYVGRLDEVVAAIQQILHPRGLFAFSVEAAEGTERPAPEGYRLGLMGRYTHQLGYLRRLARRHGFGIELLRPTRIRFEQRRPVEGWLSVWRSGSNQPAPRVE